MKHFLLLFNILLLFITSGCYEPPFSKEKLFNHMKKVALSEYHIDIDVQFNQDTLGVLYDGKNLIIKTHSNQIKPTPKFQKISTNLFMLGKRATENAKIKPEFYEMMLSSSDPTAPVRLKTTVKSDDIAQFINSVIPHKEFFLRIAQAPLNNDFLMADFIIKSIIQTLKNKDTKSLQNMLLKKGETNSSDISHMFILYILETISKDSFDIEILDLKKTPLKNNEIMVYLKIKDTYTLSPENINKKLIFPSGNIMDLLFVLSNNSIKEIHLLDKSFTFPKKHQTYKDIHNWDLNPPYYTQKTDYIWYLKSLIKHRIEYDLKIAALGDPMDDSVAKKLLPKNNIKPFTLYIPTKQEINYFYKQIQKFTVNLYKLLTVSLLEKTPFYTINKIYGLVANLNKIYILPEEHYLYNYHSFMFLLNSVKTPVTIIKDYVYKQIKAIDEYIDNVNIRKIPDPVEFNAVVRSIINKQAIVFLTRKYNISNEEELEKLMSKTKDVLSIENTQKIISDSFYTINDLTKYGFLDVMLYDLHNQKISSIKIPSTPPLSGKNT